jgi:hypothetical protein
VDASGIYFKDDITFLWMGRIRFQQNIRDEMLIHADPLAVALALIRQTLIAEQVKHRITLLAIRVNHQLHKGTGPSTEPITIPCHHD